MKILQENADLLLQHRIFAHSTPGFV